MIVVANVSTKNRMMTIGWWRKAAPTVTLLVVYKSCSLSPFASTIGFDLIGSNFYNLPPPSLLPTTLFIKTEQYRNENDKMGKTGVCPMNIHEMRSTLQRKRRQNFFRALNCKTSLKRGCRQIKLDCKQKIWSRDPESQAMKYCLCVLCRRHFGRSEQWQWWAACELVLVVVEP